MKKKPTGFVARCQCGEVTGAMDFERTHRTEAGKIIGQWLSGGCTVEPRFSGTWSVSVVPCKCEQPEEGK